MGCANAKHERNHSKDKRCSDDGVQLGDERVVAQDASANTIKEKRSDDDFFGHFDPVLLQESWEVVRQSASLKTRDKGIRKSGRPRTRPRGMTLTKNGTRNREVGPCSIFWNLNANAGIDEGLEKLLPLLVEGFQKEVSFVEDEGGGKKKRRTRRVMRSEVPK